MVSLSLDLGQRNRYKCPLELSFRPLPSVTSGFRRSECATLWPAFSFSGISSGSTNRRTLSTETMTWLPTMRPSSSPRTTSFLTSSFGMDSARAACASVTATVSILLATLRGYRTTWRSLGQVEVRITSRCHGVADFARLAYSRAMRGRKSRRRRCINFLRCASSPWSILADPFSQCLLTIATSTPSSSTAT